MTRLGPRATPRRQRRPSRNVHGFLTALAVGALVLAVVMSAGPMPEAGAEAAARATIELRGQPAWNRNGSDVNLRLGLAGTGVEDLEVRASVHSAVTSRIAFERTLGGAQLGSERGSVDSPAGLLPVVGSDRVLTIPLQDPDEPRDDQRIRLVVNGVAGVFPVSVELIDPDTTDVVDSFVTHLVVTAGDDARTVTPLAVSWLWHIAAPPSRRPDGTPAPAFARALRHDGRLGRINTALARARGEAVTLIPTPETVAALRVASQESTRAAALLSRIRATGASAGASVLAGAYTTVNGPSLERTGLGPELGESLHDGRATLESALDTPIDRTVAPPQPLDPATLNRLRADAGTTRVVVRAGELAEADSADQFTPTRPFQLDTSVGAFQALEVNDLTSTLLVQSGADALRAQQVLAGLSVIALEQPNRSRAVVVDTPLLWDVAPDRIQPLVNGLADHPLLNLTGVGDVFDSVPAATTRDRTYTRELAAAPDTPAVVSRARYDEATRQVDAFASMVPDGDPEVAAMHEQLRLSIASGTPGTGRAVSTRRLNLIDDQVAAVTGSVVAPASRTVTLTSRRASVPLSIENDSGRALKVRIQLSSPKLTFPEGDEQVVELRPGKNRTVQVTVAARTSGTFPVVISLGSPDGGIEWQRVRYTLRSSVSNAGILLTVGAALFLALWWITHWRKSRRKPLGSTSPAVT